MTLDEITTRTIKYISEEYNPPSGSASGWAQSIISNLSDMKMGISNCSMILREIGLRPHFEMGIRPETDEQIDAVIKGAQTFLSVEFMMGEE